jgi:hypothetical protein
MNAERGTRNPKLTSHTRRRIFAALKERGLEDMRHEIQMGIVGKESLKEFTEIDGQKLLQHLGSGFGVPGSGLNSKLRKRYTRPDGVIQIHVRPDASQRKIRFCYAMIREIGELEEQLAVPGSGSRVPGENPERGTQNAEHGAPGARLDGWAKSLTKGEAICIGELMEEEIDRMIVQLRNRRGWLRKKVPGSGYRVPG